MTIGGEAVRNAGFPNANDTFWNNRESRASDTYENRHSGSGMCRRTGILRPRDSTTASGNGIRIPIPDSDIKHGFETHRRGAARREAARLFDFRAQFANTAETQIEGRTLGGYCEA
jgi:hypothetical protein